MPFPIAALGMQAARAFGPSLLRGFAGGGIGGRRRRRRRTLSTGEKADLVFLASAIGKTAAANYLHGRGR